MTENDSPRVLSEPNTVSDWGIERPDKYDSNIWIGEYGTRRYIKRDANGDIIAALLIGRRNKSKKWQLLLMATRHDKRRKGYMRDLYYKALQDVGSILNAEYYSGEGKLFASSVGLLKK
mgnify:CR=1 FL=1